jgi:subtilisin family serine protease
MSGTEDGPPPTDTLYASPQGWAVRAAGGYGDAVPGGAQTGPWNTTRGAGVRIAILDSGVDENHPDISPNLALNLSEVNQSVLPSPCDDGSPQDQSGHGTWTASLAAGALGAGTGDVAGVAPQATILNIKVLERMPASGITDTQQACQAGQPGGLLSWVLQGIEDAVAQHADVIALSLGTIVDAGAGEGAGWKSAFDQATYAATQSGAVIIAALGNDGLDLSTGTLVELPAESRGVLAITASTNPECAEILTAGATCAAGPVTRPYYSNYDPNLNAIAAPGGSYPEGAATAINESSSSGNSGWIMGACSTGLTNTADGLPANGASFGCFNLGHTAYVQAMGTSASAALAAGAAALLRAARPDLTAAQIVAALRSSATRTSTLNEPELNLAAAIAAP